MCKCSPEIIPFPPISGLSSRIGAMLHHKLRFLNILAIAHPNGFADVDAIIKFRECTLNPYGRKSRGHLKSPQFNCHGRASLQCRKRLAYTGLESVGMFIQQRVLHKIVMVVRLLVSLTWTEYEYFTNFCCSIECFDIGIMQKYTFFFVRIYMLLCTFKSHCIHLLIGDAENTSGD